MIRKSVEIQEKQCNSGKTLIIQKNIENQEKFNIRQIDFSSGSWISVPVSVPVRGFQFLRFRFQSVRFQPLRKNVNDPEKR